MQPGKKFPVPTALTMLTNFISVICLFKVASSTLSREYDLIFGNLEVLDSRKDCAGARSDGRAAKVSEERGARRGRSEERDETRVRSEVREDRGGR